jgi:hypothetical protein
MQLRNTFHRLFKKACELLRTSTNPIDMTTWKILSSQKVKVFPFDALNENDFYYLKEDYEDETKKKLPAYYPPSKHTTVQLDKTWHATIRDNRIYISHYLKDERHMKKILVHEINHFLNNSKDHYSTRKQIFQEEFRAKIAEKMSNNIPLTRYRLKRIAQNVSEIYKTPIPFPLEVPKGIYYHEDALIKRNKMR